MADFRKAQEHCGHEGALAKQLAKSIATHEAEIETRTRDLQSPAPPQSLAEQARKLSAQLSAAGKKLRRKEAPLAKFQEDQALLQEKMATARDGIKVLSHRIQELQQQAADMPAEVGSGPTGPGPDPAREQGFYDKVIDL